MRAVPGAGNRGLTGARAVRHRVFAVAVLAALSRYRAYHHVGPDDPPTLLIHGDADERAPIRQSERIAERFRPRGWCTGCIMLVAQAQAQAQAQAEGMTLVTRDARMPLYGVRILAAWGVAAAASTASFRKRSRREIPSRSRRRWRK